MSNKVKNWIRAVVIVGVVAWPTIEAYRLWVTSQKMEQALALERSVRIKLEAQKAKQVQVAKATPPNPANAGNK